MTATASNILRRFAEACGFESRRSWLAASVRAAAVSCLLLLLGTAAGVEPARAQTSHDTLEGEPGGVPEPIPELPIERSEDPLFSLDSPIGPFEYKLGRGLRFGNTGLNIGGFLTAEIEKERGENGVFAIDGINFLVLFEPIPPLRLFMEIEVGDLYEVDMHTGISESGPTANFQRLFGEISINDALNVRLGKTLTPVGRWNLAPAEPFVWTATQPRLVEGFDEHTSAAMIRGSFFPSQGSINYWVYAEPFSAFDPEEDEEPAERMIGGRAEYTADLGSWSVGSSFLASRRDMRWGYLAGLDAVYHWGPLEFTSEFTYLWGDTEDPYEWDIYLQGVWEFLPKLYLVGRYEYSAGIGPNPSANIGDVGLTWLPTKYLNLKATYRFSDERVEDLFEGFKASFTVLF